MKINNKYIIGTHIMFYEIEMVSEHIQSIINSINEVDNQENVSVDLFFNISEYFEKIDRSKISKKELISRFTELVLKLENETNSKITSTIYDTDEPLTMVDYRRDLNHNGCKNHDYVIWGESDCLLPKELFEALELIKNYANEKNVHRYITTFAVRKMWDEHWKPLEHVDMTDKPLHQKFLPDGSKNPLAYNEPYSIRYTMGIDEMNEINKKYSEFDIRIMNHPHFDGSGLVISSDLIKTGVNVPLSIIGHAVDDTSMMTMCRLLMGDKYVQFIVKNILKVHNRDHPKKRNYCLQMDSDEICTQEKGPNQRGGWYENLKNMANVNLSNCGSSQNRFFNYDDFKKVMEKE